MMNHPKSTVERLYISWFQWGKWRCAELKRTTWVPSTILTGFWYGKQRYVPTGTYIPLTLKWVAHYSDLNKLRGLNIMARQGVPHGRKTTSETEGLLKAIQGGIACTKNYEKHSEIPQSKHLEEVPRIERNHSTCHLRQRE